MTEKLLKKIFIKKKYFDLSSGKSKGLISGLKKISDKNIMIFSDINIDNNLVTILELEGIKINKSSEDEFDNNSIINYEKKFSDAANEFITKLRYSKQHRKTRETDIKLEVSLDGIGRTEINTGIGFFDHMLEQIAKHANINLKIDVAGDLHIDEHHTVEDVGITLGTGLSDALGEKKGIKRYGFFLPMDDADAQCGIDLSGRSYLNFKCKFKRERVGEFPTELTKEFFMGVAAGLKANIYIRAKAKNDHHKIEAIFKAFAKSLNEACRMDERTEGALPSTKGLL